MSDIDIVVEICGSAGEGTISAGEILSRFMSEEGYDIMSFDSYPAEIRGFGKCVAHSRISRTRVLTPGKYSDVLIALNDSHSISQLPVLKEQGVLIYDNKPPKYHDEDKSIAGWLEPGMIPYGIPLNELAIKAAGNARGRNMVALGAFAALFGISQDAFIQSVKRRYGKKKQVVIDNNVDSFVEGFNWTRDNVRKIDFHLFDSSPSDVKRDQLIINGNEAVARGALAAGLHLYAGYPITPATKIMEILSKELPKKGGVFLQTEDEISSIGHVMGAGFAGKRAMTGTSGPGFCLMSEFTGLSVMAEVPAVIVNSQRGGPSTGLPTKHEQSDLNIALFGGSGDSPRVVIAPTSVDQCYQAAVLALYIAEKYQTLVILLIDFFLSNSIKNLDPPPPPDPRYLNANIAPGKDELKDYKRYQITENGISPRTIPGTPGGMFFSTGLEHDERGKPVYDTKTHTLMTEKRFRKHREILKEIPEPRITGWEGQGDIGVVSWGSSAGAAEEAVILACEKGLKVGSFSSMVLSPFPANALVRFCDRFKTILVPEMNYSGQFANMIAPIVTRPVMRLNMVTGLPMASEDILKKIKEIK
ncbi:MAG: 2-oxoacid:acceptor oxidoreductase subunit alpha [Proteobacteria bacterium]|nr:2-oxoacid:acceptor oxidoreductase subunit alpha [Pseudomonadota bacterium]